VAKSPSAEGIYVTCRRLGTDLEESYPAEQLRFRPAAYGIYVRAGKVLLGRSRFTGKWDIPGGGVEPWETLTEGVEREFLEETGVEITATRLVDFREGFVAFGRHPFHSLRYYYLVSGEGAETLTPDLEELSSVAWVERSEIQPDECARGDFDLIARLLTSEGTRG